MAQNYQPLPLDPSPSRLPNLRPMTSYFPEFLVSLFGYSVIALTFTENLVIFYPYDI